MIDALGQNSITLGGILVERSALRLTPAAVPVIECVFEHRSEQREANLPRQIECRIPAVALGQCAQHLNAATLGIPCQISGFLAAKSLQSRQLRLHITEIKFLEGN